MKKSYNIMNLNTIFTFFLFVISMNARAAVIFQDDFESDPSSWTCGNGQLSKWSEGWIECGFTSGFGYEWKMGPGREGGNSLYAWKKDSVPNGYRSASERWLSGGELYSEVYHRWYMKVPNELDKSISEGFKFWRYILRENGYSSAPEIYLNVYGNTYKSGSLAAILNGATILPLVLTSDFSDGNWHCHELRIKLNSNGLQDGILQYWLDGNLKKTINNLTFSSVSNLKIYRIGVGIGNVSDSPWYMTNWTGVGFDDVVLSTWYNGTIGSSIGGGPGGASSPNPPANLQINP